MSTQAERFASCVKKVTKDFRPSSLPRSSSTRSYNQGDKEGVAIAICTKSILWPQKRTLKKFYMDGDKPVLITQPKKKGGRTRKLKPSKK